MKYVISLVYIFSIFTALLLISSPSVNALSENVVILQVQTASSTSASEEIIVLYNTSDDPVNITDWCVNYGSSTDITKKKLACVGSGDPLTAIYIEAKGMMSFSSGEFVIANPGFVPDYTFTAGLAATGGHVWLADSTDLEIDRLGWGTAVSPEGLPASAHSSGKTISRNYLDEVVDTDDNKVDFSSIALVNPISSDLYEEAIVVDVCPNIDELQIEIPVGYLQDVEGNCQLDFCPNLDNLQVALPVGYEKNLESGECTLIPLEDAVLFITELLPNAPSIDTGNEFIEIYNPNLETIELKGYVLQIGPSFTKEYFFTSGSITSMQYIVVSDTSSGLVLPNATGVQLRLIAPNGTLVSESNTYSNAGDDVSWALVEDQWIYTNQITPELPNKPYLEPAINEVAGITTVYAPCPEGKFRNPETNRCKTIETAVSVLSPCDEDEYRNPETNRCRKITASTSSLVPCKVGQERNPETNRCRSITSSTLVPCSAGQERNPETNRCRKVSVLGASADEIATITDVAVENTAGQINWAIISVALFLTFGYMIYEWRSELSHLYSRMMTKQVQ